MADDNLILESAEHLRIMEPTTYMSGMPSYPFVFSILFASSVPHEFVERLRSGVDEIETSNRS